MAHSPQKRYYAVKIGRAPGIYGSWSECSRMVTRYPGAEHKCFKSKNEAEEWLNQPPSTNGPNRLPRAAHPAFWTPNGSTNHVKPMSVAGPASDEPIGPKIELSPEQTAVLSLVKSGRNVFFTGSAGTGKSVLLREIIKARGGHSFRLAITASTGMAAVNIKGVTLHSWAGIGLGDKPPHVYVKMFGHESFDKVVQRWRNVETLILDEISMINGILFDKLEYIARKVRRNDQPFGGIQLVLSGDFCQLPPVDANGSGAAFAFHADSWDRCVGSPVTLTRVFRQRDQDFVDMLNEMRFGRLSDGTVERMRSLARTVVYNDSIEPTDLFPTKREVEKENQTRLDKLEGSAMTYTATDRPGENDLGRMISQADAVKLLNKNVIASEVVTLKIGAQVMLVKNLVQGELVNGSVGRVIAFYSSLEAQNNNTDFALVDRGQNPREKFTIPRAMLLDPTRWPVVRFTNGSTKVCAPEEFTIENLQGTLEASRYQVPLILAWALSIHKSQGQTLERVRVNLARVFTQGQAYVALSRATSMETLQVLGFDAAKVCAHPHVIAWNDEIVRLQKERQEFQEEMDQDEAIMSYFSP